ncbi:MAG TPA: V-type ATP synthase subunit D, partial [Bacillota bacterium]|nr:V-type ATP synthase subunit D [Bacillota bacterium]
SVELDRAIKLLSDTMPLLIELAEVEKSVELLAEAIEGTRRRVNALEHILIPQLETDIKYIRMKLEEAERGNLTRLMKVKDIVRAKSV